MSQEPVVVYRLPKEEIERILQRSKRYQMGMPFVQVRDKTSELIRSGQYKEPDRINKVLAVIA